MVQVKIEPKKEYLYAKLEGSFELHSMVRSQAAILEAGARHEIGKILVDFREMTGEISITERFQFAEAGSHKYSRVQ